MKNPINHKCEINIDNSPFSTLSDNDYKKRF